MELSKEIKALTEENWFPIMMEELGYVKKEKAIPIKWIKKWYRRSLDSSGFMGDETISVGDLLDDWEKENDR